MKKILVITPHLSTGGAPQVTLNKIKLLNDNYIIKCVEYDFFGFAFVIQRNQVEKLLGSNFHSLGDNKNRLLDIIDEFKPDVISMEEFPEFFMDDNITKLIYKSDRSYTILETTHDSSFPVTSKRFFPDKFIFVSAFNGFRYSIYDIPYEIVEYPVDYKNPDKQKNQRILEFDPTYKHVLNVGLFTERKNQSYVFEIARRLEEYKIKFHFLGNQADNFKSYWKPLLDDKPDNCILWGERKDVPSFIEASDLFFFASKGDRNNKELNPIALKEALEYKIPMLMYNLDVYCSKYDNYENISFITGDIEKDIEILLRIIKPEKINDSYENIEESEGIIITTYPDTIKRKNLTLDCINSFKKLNRKIILVSHYPVSLEIQKEVDYYIYDKNNMMIPNSYYNKFYSNTEKYRAEININNSKKPNQSLAAFINLYNGMLLAKQLGISKVMTVTYDVILNDLDIELINGYFDKLDNNWKCCLSKMNTDLGEGIETTSMVFRTNYFLEIFSDIRDGDIFNNLCIELGCQNFLEDYFMRILKDEELLWIVNNDERTILPNSGLGVSSNSEYFSLIPVNDSTNIWAFYFFTYNLDEKELEITILENEIKIFNERIKISETREYVKKIEYRNIPIDINVLFYDGENVYKKENYKLNNETVSHHYNNGMLKENI
jgi:hypothetical protein